MRLQGPGRHAGAAHSSCWKRTANFRHGHQAELSCLQRANENIRTTASPSWRERFTGRRIGVAALFVYGLTCILRPDEYRILDSVDLAIHETGHLVFSPFGEFLQMLGGTLFQLMIPLAFVWHFWRRRDRFASAVVLFWVAQNCWNIARYIADARAQELPLVGGGEHDWAYLLGTLGWLRHDQTLSTMVTGIGVLLFATSVWFGWRYGGDASVRGGALTSRV